MKCFIIQINPARDNSINIDAFICMVRTQGKFPEVEPDYEDTTLTNLNFFTEMPNLFWQELQTKILSHPDFAQWIQKVAIVVCEGEHGWDDALLLAHYNANEPLDDLPKNETDQSIK